MEIIRSMSEPHLLLRWAKANEMSVKQVADAADCSEWHLRNLLAGRREASLSLASRLSAITGGAVPMDAFLKASAAEVRA